MCSRGIVNYVALNISNEAPNLVAKNFKCNNKSPTYFPIMYRGGYVYILTNWQRTTLYIGVTASLEQRLWKHKNHAYGPESFSAKYNLDILVYYESFDTIAEAIVREKQLKKWSRIKKDQLINSLNPEWKDLSTKA